MTPTAPANPPAPTVISPRTVISIDAEAFIMLGALGWLLWEKVLRGRIVRHLDGVFAPVEEERALNDLLAQIALLAGANRVLLCAFHNGHISSGGYSLTKLSVVNSYLADGTGPMASPIRDMPLGRVMSEVEGMLAAHTAGRRWVFTHDGDHLTEPCRDHLRRNDIVMMYNRLVLVGNLPIGILSIQYCVAGTAHDHLENEPQARLIEHLYHKIAEIMRRRVIHPSPIRKLLYRLTGGNQSSPTA